jgi:transcriptional regulator with XRE-family HTH domain
MTQHRDVRNSKLDIQLQIQNDINNYVSCFNNPSLGEKSLAKKSGVHNKTIKRLRSLANNPTHGTILKLYSVLLGETNPEKLFALLPDSLRSLLVKDSINILPQNLDHSSEIKREILSDKVFCEIYFLIDAGNVSKELIQFKFGEHGLDILERMYQLNAIRYNNENLIELGKSRLEYSPEVIKHAGQLLSRKYSKTSLCEVKGENFLGLYVDSLPEQAYQEWLKIDKDAFIKKAEIAKNYRDEVGGKKVFTYMTTDSFKKDSNELL